MKMQVASEAMDALPGAKTRRCPNTPKGSNAGPDWAVESNRQEENRSCQKELH